MRLPNWLKECLPSELEKQVEGLPIEKIKLGRRTLGAYRRAWAVCLAAIFTMAGYISLGLIALYLRGELGGPMSAISLTLVMLSLPINILMLVPLMAGARRSGLASGPAESWENCEKASAPGALRENMKKAFSTRATIVNSLSGVLVCIYCSSVFPPALLIAGMIGIMASPTLQWGAANVWSKALRGLFGLCKDSGMKAPQKVGPSIRERLEGGVLP